MQLIIQPDSGAAPTVTAIKQAKKTIDVLIFRLDREEILEALEAAVKRGVAVRALIAHTNSGGEKALRKLEMRLLEGGVTVARTGDDLVRYHGKLMIVDRRMLHLYGFNFTAADMKRSRSFGIITKHKKFVDEAVKVFEADSARQPYVPGSDRFIVSPENARQRLTRFIGGARKQLLIYDPKVSDPALVTALATLTKKGVDIRIIGDLGRKAPLTVEKYPGERLHVRAIIRDGRQVFVGSQSLRRLELERRREIGVIIDNAFIVRTIKDMFEKDWALTPSGKKERKDEKKEEKDKARSDDGAKPSEAHSAA